MCPQCNRILVGRDVGEIEIDACESCGGIWLDAGEFDGVAARYRTKDQDREKSQDRADLMETIASFVESLSDDSGDDWDLDIFD
jgi:Zn-finger nucleic acid-binding protein